TSRKASSPSRSKNSRIEQPRCCSITWSESANERFSRRANWRPKGDLPGPGRPTRTTPGSRVVGLVGTTFCNCGFASTCGHAIRNHLRGDEDQHFLLVGSRPP